MEITTWTIIQWVYIASCVYMIIWIYKNFDGFMKMVNEVGLFDLLSPRARIIIIMLALTLLVVIAPVMAVIFIWITIKAKNKNG